MSPLDLAQSDTEQPSVRIADGDEVRLVRAADRRAHARRSASELAWLRDVKLTGGTGFTASLIDLSEGGALIEVDGPLRPGARLTLEINGAGLDGAVPLEVLRAYIGRFREGIAFYRGACVFDFQIALPDGTATTTSAAATPGGFVGTDAALAYLLDRCVAGDSPTAPATHSRVTLERAELLHVLEALHARGRKDRSDPGTRIIVELLAAILPPLQGGAPRNVVMKALESRMKSWPASLQARLQPTRMRLASLIDRCAVVSPLTATVDFPSGETEDDAPAESTDKDGAFQRIVVRYVDGGIAKGFTQDFHPSRPQFSLWPAINSKPSERLVVPLANLKAVFFVRSFNGNPARQDRKTFGARGQAQGRRLEVTFRDTEVILGTTLNYRPDAQGFFVVPADAGGNNTRVFVMCSAVQRVRFF